MRSSGQGTDGKESEIQPCIFLETHVNKPSLLPWGCEDAMVQQPSVS